MDLMAPWVSNSGLAPQSFCSIFLLVLSLSLVFLCMRILRIRETEKYIQDHTAYKRQGSFWTQLCLTPKHIFCTTPFCPLLRYYVQEINIFCPISLPKLKSWHSPAQFCSHSHLLHQSRPIWASGCNAFSMVYSSSFHFPSSGLRSYATPQKCPINLECPSPLSLRLIALMIFFTAIIAFYPLVSPYSRSNNFYIHPITWMNKCSRRDRNINKKF